MKKPILALGLLLYCLFFFSCVAPQGGYTFQGGIPFLSGSPIGLNQDVLVIYVRASDNTTPNLATLRSSEEAEFASVNRFFQESSFSQTSFNFTHAPATSSATNWYVLPKTYDEYMWTQADINAANKDMDADKIKEAKELVNTTQDIEGFFVNSLQKALDENFNVLNFSQICVVIIGVDHRGTSFKTTNFTLKDASGDDLQFNIPVIVVSNDRGWSRTAHEFGHAFGSFIDLYAPPQRPLLDWDIMDCTDCMNQTTGWHKDFRAGWFNANANMATITRPVGTSQKTVTTTLIPYETQSPSTGQIQSIKLEVGGGTYLYIENRQKIPNQVGSAQLPSNGVIITDAIDYIEGAVTNRPPILMFGGPITPGNTFTNNAYGPLKVEVSGANPNLIVKTTWGPDPFFDLVINTWDDPPPFESPDIWIDSQENQFGIYECNDAAENPGIPGNPVRNGDRPWINKYNRVYGRIHNTGSTDVSNVKVSFYENTMQAIGEFGNWSLLATKTIPIIAAGSSGTEYVDWKPLSSDASHTCLKVVIEPMPGELNANNNEAQENVTDFNTSSSSPWTIVESVVSVTNPTEIYQSIKMEMNGLPTGWTGWLNERFFSLAPHASKIVTYRIDPNGGKGALSTAQIERGFKVDINVDGWMLRGDESSRIGGITACVHAVYTTDKIEITGYPKNGFAMDSDREANIAVVLTPQVNLTTDVPITLEFEETSQQQRQVVIQPAKSINNSIDKIARFNLFALVNSGQLSLVKGKNYKVTASLYGTKWLEGGKASKSILLTVK